MEEDARGGEKREVEAGEGGGEVGVGREEGHDAAEVGGVAEEVAGDEEATKEEREEARRWCHSVLSFGRRGESLYEKLRALTSLTVRLVSDG